MTSDTVLLDTTLTEPSLTPDEAEMLLFALDRSRAQFAWKCGGLDSAALHRPFPPSAMTLAGMVKHMALVEDLTVTRLTGRLPGAPWDAVDWDAEPGWDWRSAAEDSPEELYRLWRDAAGRGRAAAREVLAAGGLDRPATFWPDSDDVTNARRLLVDLHEEYARHVGHADLFREAIDGMVGEDPPQPS